MTWNTGERNEWINIFHRFFLPNAEGGDPAKNITIKGITIAIRNTGDNFKAMELDEKLYPQFCK